MRDLTDASPDEIAAERARVAREGWGARILSLQGGDGRWAAPHGTADGAELVRSIVETQRGCTPMIVKRALNRVSARLAVHGSKR